MKKHSKKKIQDFINIALNDKNLVYTLQGGIIPVGEADAALRWESQ